MYFEQNISGPIFIADAPDVVIGSANSGNVRATITVNGDSWDIELSPSLQDGEYKARLRLKDVLDSIVGSPDFLDATASTIAPKVSIKADNGMEEAVSMEFQALYGNAEGKTPADMKRHWLTWREQISATTRSAREFLTFVSGLKLLGWKAGTFSAMARLFIHGSEPIDIPISEGQLESDCKYYKICYSPSKLCEAASVDISKLMAIDCWFSLSGTDSGGSSASVTSFPLRMIVSGANDLRMKEFIFRNSLGIEDRVISFGVNTRNVDGESRVFTSDGLSHELDNSSIESFQVQSGNISSARGAALWSDFLKASGRYMVSGEKATEIVVEEWDTDITEGALGSVSFKYHLSRTDFGRWFEDSESLGNYDPLEKFGALSVAGPEVATPPAEDLFFLKTRLDEFPLVELGEDFLLLVQSSASYSWGSASLKSLRDWLAKNVSTEALQLWCGPWEDYSEAVSKFALSAGAGKELLDIINKMDIASLMGSTAIGGIRSYLYWNGSAWATKALGDNAFTSISKLSQLTNDSGYITGITKSMVEAVLTGNITTHTHSQYLTAHQPIYALTIQKNGTTVGTYTPNSQAATINISDVASAATLSAHTTNTTVHITANERTLWNKITGLFDVDTDGDVYVKNGKGFYTEGFISAGAKGSGSGGGSSYTQKEWLQIKEMTESASGILASAYAVKEAYNELNTAIETLAGKATNVTFSQTLTSGKQIGLISIDGKSTSLFAPANYAWSEVTGKPTFATVATSGSYADLTNKPTIASLMGSAAIGGTSSFIYWNGSTFVSKALGDNAFTSISKLSQLTNDSGYITGITKSMVEGVLTGDVTSHTHSQYLTAHQTVSLASGTNNGTLKLTVGSTTTDNIAVKGLGSAAYTNSSAYAAASHTHSQYLTAHQPIYALTIQKNGTTVGTYTPNSQAATINISDVASAATLSTHTTNTTVHITANERTLWNKITGLFDVDTDGDVYVKNGKGFYTEGFISAGAKGTSGGGSSTYTQKEWAQIKDMTATVAGSLASAYAVKEAYSEAKTLIDANTGNITSLTSRVTTLEGKATAVSFLQTLTTGTKIGAITVDGITTNIYAPTPPTKVSQLTNDSGYITGITKAMVEGVLTGNITSHTHSYIPLSDKGLSNGKVPYYINFPNFKQLVDLGYNEESTKTNEEAYFKGLCKWAIDNFAGQGQILLIGNAAPNSYGFCYIQLYSSHGKDTTTGLPRYCSGTYISLDRATTNFSCINYIWTFGGSFYGNAASSSKWATPRTITLTGSVTGSVSIDGSQNVSLATTTNHTHTFASLTSKPTTISGYGITDAYTKTQTDTKLSGYLPLTGGTLYSNSSSIVLNLKAPGSAVDSIIRFSDATTSEIYEILLRRPTTLFGLQCNINGNYYNLIHSGNYNSYAPTLTGTGASGTWGISISGNAATATNADTLDGQHNIGQVSDWNSWVGSFRISAENTATNAPAEGFHYGYQMQFHRQPAVYYTDLITNLYRDELYFRRRDENGYGAWKQIAFLDSNVASATKLANSRTIWGQSFDGTGNVDGIPSFPACININRNAQTGALLNSSKIGFEIETYANDARLKTYSASGGRNPYHLVLTSNGNVGIGTASPSYKLHIAGVAYASEGLVSDGYISAASTSTSSDIRLKDNISEISSEKALKMLSMLKPKSWTWNSLAGVKGRSMGFVAQDIEGILPQMIRKRRDNGFLSLDYTQLHALEVSALQSHEKRIEELERENKILKEELYKLKLNAN